MNLHALNVFILQECCRKAATLGLTKKRKLMLSAYRYCLFSTAVNVAKTDDTGALKAELRKLLRAKLNRLYHSDPEEWANMYILPEGKALCELEEWKPKTNK